MLSKSAKRQHDSIAIPEGLYIEPYTPVAGPIISPSLNQVVAYVKIHATDEGTITGKDSRGNLISDFPIAKGSNVYLFSEIHSASTVIWIIHDGVKASSEEIMNYHIRGIEQ